MLIWLYLLIPCLTAIVLFTLWRARLWWGEYAALFLVSVVVIALAKFAGEFSRTVDTEYWGNYVTRASYFEAWNEEVSCSHLDDDGDPEHAYDVDEHDEEWELEDDGGDVRTCSQEEYEHACRVFGAKRKVELHRDYHDDDGDEWRTVYPGNEAQMVTLTTPHLYENRVIASRSVFTFEPVSEAEAEAAGLFAYPAIDDRTDYPTLLGYGGPGNVQASRELQILNAVLGAPYQVRVWVLVFLNQPRETGLLQERYWQGGNKNEFVVTVGIDASRAVQWAHVFSWSESTALKVEAREFVQAQKPFDPVALAGYLRRSIPGGFVRKPFADFAYLSVEPPTWAYLVGLILVLLANVLVGWWAVNNDANDMTPLRRMISTPRRRVRYRSYR